MHYPGTPLYICCVQYSVRPGISPLRSYSETRHYYQALHITLSNIHTMTSSDRSTWCRGDQYCDNGIDLCWSWRIGAVWPTPDQGTTPRVRQQRAEQESHDIQYKCCPEIETHMIMVDHKRVWVVLLYDFWYEYVCEWVCQYVWYEVSPPFLLPTSDSSVQYISVVQCRRVGGEEWVRQ